MKQKRNVDKNLHESIQPKLIALFGGTFDPIHDGHIAIANHVLKNLSVDHIEFIPCYLPPLHATPIANAQDRLNMVKLAIQKNSRCEINDIEIQRKGVSYTIDTVKSVRKKEKQNILCLMVGADAFLQFHTWKNWKTILKLAHIVVINRIGVDLTPIHSLLKNSVVLSENTLYKNQAGCILLLSMKPISISATDIRQKIQMGERHHITGLPKSVSEYIFKHHVYI